MTQITAMKLRDNLMKTTHNTQDAVTQDKTTCTQRNIKKHHGAVNYFDASHRDRDVSDGENNIQDSKLNNINDDMNIRYCDTDIQDCDDSVDTVTNIQDHSEHGTFNATNINSNELNNKNISSKENTTMSEIDRLYCAANGNITMENNNHTTIYNKNTKRTENNGKNINRTENNRKITENNVKRTENNGKIRENTHHFPHRTLAVGVILLLGFLSGHTLTSVLLLCCLSLLLHYTEARYTYWARLGVPAPPASLLVGHTLRRLGITMPFMDFFDELYEHYNGREMCGYYDFFTPGLFVGHPELVKAVLVRDFLHFSDRRTFDLGKVNPIANDMLTNATGPHWRFIRSAVSPAFTASKTRRLGPLLNDRATHLTQLAREEAKEGHVEARGLCGRYTMDAIASCAFGIECGALTSHATAFPKMASRLFQLSPVRAVKILILLVAPRLAHLIHRLGMDFTSPEFHFFRRVVTHTLRVRGESGRKRGDFIDLMMETRSGGREGLSDNAMAAQSILFLLAGYDNTANTLALALHLLAHHPHAQATLRRELALALTKGGGEVCGVMELPYLDAVVSETLRLYPAAPVIERICTKPYMVGQSGVRLECGQPVIIPVWSIHRDPHYWPDPHAFSPDRFMGANKNSITPYSYLPFGHGPRSCIGFRFAMLSVKMGLVHLLTKMTIHPSPKSTHPLALDPRVLTLQPKDGVYVDLRPFESGLETVLEEEMRTFPPRDGDDVGVASELARLRSDTVH